MTAEPGLRGKVKTRTFAKRRERHPLRSGCGNGGTEISADDGGTGAPRQSQNPHPWKAKGAAPGRKKE